MVHQICAALISRELYLVTEPFRVTICSWLAGVLPAVCPSQSGSGTRAERCPAAHLARPRCHS